MKNKREDDYFTLFWSSLRINNCSSSELINEIKSLSKGDSFKFIIQQKKKEALWKIQKKYFCSNNPSFNIIAVTLFEEIIHNNMFTENEFMCFCFSLLLLTNDFKLLDEKKVVETLIQFFRIFKFRKVLYSDINNNLYLDVLDAYYLSCFFVNMVTLKTVKEVASLSDDKGAFELKYNFTFSHTFQNRLLAEFISEIIKEAEIHDLDRRWDKLLEKFKQIELLARSEYSSRVILPNYNNFSTNVTLGNSKQIKPEEFNTGILGNGNKEKINTSSKELPLKSDRTDHGNLDKNSICKDIFNHNKDQIWVSIQLFNKHIIGLVKQNKWIRERLAEFSKRSFVKNKL